MDCERSLILLVADMDQEIQAEERTLLDEHLTACVDCRAAAAAFRLQDAELRRAFAPRRRAVKALASRVIAQLPPIADKVRSRVSWSPMLAAAAIGFLLAVGVFRPWERASRVVQDRDPQSPA